MTDPRVEAIRDHYHPDPDHTCPTYEEGPVNCVHCGSDVCKTCGMDQPTHQVRDLLAAYDQQAQWLKQVPEWGIRTDTAGEQLIARCLVCQIAQGEPHTPDCWFAQKEQP